MRLLSMLNILSNLIVLGGGGGGYFGHATQNLVKSARVRTIITMQEGQPTDMARLTSPPPPNTIKEYFTPIILGLSIK